MLEILNYSFITNALISALFIGPLLGIIGTLVVSKKMAFYSEAIGHAAMTGIAIGIILGENYSTPYFSTFGYSILFGILIIYTKTKTDIALDTLIGIFLAVSISIGASLLTYTAGTINPHIIENILFGSILTIEKVDIYILITITVLVFIILYPCYNKFLLISINPSIALARKINIKFYEYLFIILLSITTIGAIKIVGSILGEALLLIPTASAKNISHSMRAFIGYSILFSTLSCILGIILPAYLTLSIPSGAAVILSSTIIFIISIIIKKFNFNV